MKYIRYFQIFILEFSLILSSFQFPNIAQSASQNFQAGSVLINEVCTDPQQDWDSNEFNGIPGNGSITSSDEFIELYNASGKPIDLTGWRIVLDDGTKDDVEITAALVKNEQPEGDVSQFQPDEYWTLGNPAGSMNNDIRIELFSSDTSGAPELIDAVTLGNFDDGFIENNAPNGNASSGDNEVVARDHKQTDSNKDNADFWNTRQTMGAQNPVTNSDPIIIVEAPLAGKINETIRFDASKSSDVDEDPMSFSWDFDNADGVTDEAQGNIVTHEFTEARVYVITLTVYDNRGGTSIKSLSLTIEKKEYPDGIRLNEFLPNPIGPDTTDEFIELYNSGDEDMNLGGWSLDDGAEGSKPFLIPEQFIIEQDHYAVFKSAQTNISINNSSETIRLFDPNGELKDGVSFEGQAQEGESYNFLIDEWAWSDSPTPGSANIITRPPEDKVPDDGDDVDDSPSPSDPDDQEDTPEEPIDNKQSLISIAEVKTLSSGKQINTSGVVTMIPGEISNQYFYIQDNTAGIKIYSSKGQFPSLQRGQQINVNGKVSVTKYETKIIAASTESIVKQSNNIQLIKPAEYSISQLTQQEKGLLIKTSGAITEKTSGNITLINDKSQIRMKRHDAINKNISTDKYIKGITIAVTGIIEENKDGLVLVPRSAEDVAFTTSKGSTTSTKNNEKLISTGPDIRYFFPNISDAILALFFKKCFSTGFFVLY